MIPCLLLPDAFKLVWWHFDSKLIYQLFSCCYVIVFLRLIGCVNSILSSDWTISRAIYAEILYLEPAILLYNEQEALR